MAVSRSTLTLALLACTASLVAVLYGDALLAKATIEEAPPGGRSGGSGYYGPWTQVCEGMFCSFKPTGVDEGDSWDDAPFLGNLSYASLVVPLERGQVLRLEQFPLLSSNAEFYVLDTVQYQARPMSTPDGDQFMEISTYHVYHHQPGGWAITRGLPPDAVSDGDRGFTWDGGSVVCGSRDPQCQNMTSFDQIAYDGPIPPPALELKRVDLGPDPPRRMDAQQMLWDRLGPAASPPESQPSGLVLLWIGHREQLFGDLGDHLDRRMEGEPWLYTINPSQQQMHPWFLASAWVLGGTSLALAGVMIAGFLRGRGDVRPIQSGVEPLFDVADGAARYLRSLRTALLGCGILLALVALLAFPFLRSVSESLRLLHGRTAQMGVLTGLAVATIAIGLLWALQVAAVQREIRRLAELHQRAEAAV